MIHLFNRLSFTRKLILINILVILPVILIGTVVSIYLISENEKRSLQDEIRAISQLTTAYATPDLLFNDKKALSITLENLNTFPNIIYACILNNDNEIMVTYGNSNIKFIPIKSKSKVFSDKENGKLFNYQLIEYKGETLGTLVVISNTSRLDELFRNLYISSFIGGSLSFLVLLFMSAKLQSFITQPILKLVDIIDNVVKTENYKIRIDENPYKDEIGVLYKDFNLMMANIESTTVSKNYLDSVVDALPEMLLVLDENNKILSINKAVTEITGFESINLINQSPGKIFGNDIIDKILDGSITESKLQTNQKTFDISISATAFINKEILQRTILSVRNITQQKKSEEVIAEYYDELEKKNRELEKLSYITSHDLKAPLRSIGSLIMMMKEDIAGEDITREEINDYFDLMTKRTNRMYSLINGILEYSRIGRRKDNTELVDLEQLLNEVIETVIPKHFEIIKQPAFPSIHFNKIQLYQIFQNLISNAVKYNDKPIGKIELSWKYIDDKYYFEIKDNGPGIAPKYHVKVFEVFQMLQARDKVESTGIGLSIVKKIIEQSNGSIGINSDFKEGVAFYFELPKK
ncbi:MAG: PAS domain S-box-containing protein [Cognaticolwellia sp.]|jgi:PAS domain S-box-containing protein